MIGVPVYAALDGTVVEVQSQSPDFSHGANTRPLDNHVVLDHGGGYQTVYGHLVRASIRARVGQRLLAGTQLGLTGSSGSSTWPHLHFTLRYRGEAVEPFAGACRPGAGGWLAQAALPQGPYVSDLALARAPFTGRRALPWDEGARTGTFVAGRRVVHLRALVAAVAGGTDARVRVLRPDGSLALEAAPVLEDGPSQYHVVARARLALDLDQRGRWLIRLELGGRPVAQAPFAVVRSPAALRNRPPRRISVALEPAAPRALDVVVCRVATPPLSEDPDYDLVRYRFRWSVGRTIVRESTNAALSVALPRASARAGQTIACTVTPSDGRLRGPPATVSVRAG